jgi:hypothetical protein
VRVHQTKIKIVPQRRRAAAAAAGAAGMAPSLRIPLYRHVHAWPRRSCFNPL